MSALKKVPNYVVLFLMFLLTFTRTTFARIFPSLRHGAQPAVKVFALSDQAWADLRAGAEYQDTKAASGDDKKADEQKANDKKAEEKKSDDAKNDSAKPSEKQDQNKDNAKSTEPAEPAKAPDTQSPGGGDGDLGGIGG